MLIPEVRKVFMHIYKEIGKDWLVYSLMAGIAFIEEMSKPYLEIQVKNFGNKDINFLCYRRIRLKMVSKDVVLKWWKTTRRWENKLGVDFIGPKYKHEIKHEDYDGQYSFFLTPKWLYEIVKTVGVLPSSFANELCKKRIVDIRTSGGKRILSDIECSEIESLNWSEYQTLFSNKRLAAGAFAISFDLEFKGVQIAAPCLCMSEKYFDFLEFMRSLAFSWGWTSADCLHDVDVSYSRRRGINASPQKSFQISINAFKEIYNRAGPLADSEKDSYARFHMKRLSGKWRERQWMPGVTKKLIYDSLCKKGESTSTLLQKDSGVRADVVLDHLHNLESEGRVIKERCGKKYIWRPLNAN